MMPETEALRQPVYYYRKREHIYEHGESNKLQLRFLSRAENVAMARLIASGLAADRGLTIAELDEIRVAVSEAVSNAIIHGYNNQEDCYVQMDLALSSTQLVISIHDDGVGMADPETETRPSGYMRGERMGLGFAFMRSFMDEVEVQSQPGEGTTVTLYKSLA